MKRLPYRANTETGDIFDFAFPLHTETLDPVRVGQLVTALIATIEREFKITGQMGNGDVLQALAIATAIRTRMIHASHDTTAALSIQLLRDALAAAAYADRISQQSGRA